MSVVQRITECGEEISCGRRIASCDLADDRRSRPQDRCATAEHFQLRGLNVNLHDARHGEASCQPVQRDRRHKLSGPHATRLSCSEAVKMTGGTVAPGDMKPGDVNLVGDGYGQDFDRCDAVVGNRRFPKQPDELSIRLQRQDTSRRTRRHRSGKAEQADVGADVPDHIAWPDYLCDKPQQIRVNAAHGRPEIPQPTL